MHLILKSIIFIIFSIACSANDSYEQSDLGINSQSIGIRFYNNVQETNSTFFESATSLSPELYSSAVIYSKNPTIGDLALEPFKHEGVTIYFHCLDKGSQYKNLESYLAQISKAYTETFWSIPKSEASEETPLEFVIEDLKTSSNICITFGAGFSGGYVPTLIEFFNLLGLEKQSSIDAATDESMQDFVKNLIDNKKDILNKVRKEWLTVKNCEIKTTPAHKALFNITRLLIKNQKNVFVYTDNIDGIHHKVGIQLSEQYIPEDSVTLIKYPPEEKLKDSKTTVLVCGQSFDFHGVLSTIFTRRNSMERLVFYSFNIQPDSFFVYDGLDVDILDDQLVDISKLPAINLPTKWIKGSIHDRFPDFYKMLKELYERSED